MLNPLDPIAVRVKRLRIIWFALLLGVASFYLVVWFILKGGRDQLPPPMDPSYLIALGVLFLIPLLVSPFVRRKVEATPRDASEEAIADRWQAGWVIGQALKEATGIGGLVLALLAGSTAYAFAFTVASVLSMLMTPPWEHELRLRIHRATGTAGTSLGG